MENPPKEMKKQAIVPLMKRGSDKLESSRQPRVTSIRPDIESFNAGN